MQTKFTPETFDAFVAASPKPVLVYWHGPWCSACEAMKPTMAELEQEFADRYTFTSLEPMEAPDLVDRYDIRTLPTTMILKRGEQPLGLLGAYPKSIITDWLEEQLG